MNVPTNPFKHALRQGDMQLGLWSGLSNHVTVTLVKDGDHRLSRPQDLVLLRRTLAALLGDDGV